MGLQQLDHKKVSENINLKKKLKLIKIYQNAARIQGKLQKYYKFQTLLNSHCERVPSKQIKI